MEGVGSTRLGRASSRYGGAPSATAVFDGPVRKWKKKWVHVSSSSTVNFKTSQSRQSNGQNNNNSSRLLLCRWTPLSSSSSSSSSSTTTTTTTPENGGDQKEEQPPKRRFRYTPVAVLEEKERAVAKKIEEEEEAKASEENQFTAWSASKVDELNIATVLKSETQDSSTSHLDLGLCLEGHDGHNDSGKDKEGQSKRESSGGWADTQYLI